MITYCPTSALDRAIAEAQDRRAEALADERRNVKALLQVWTEAEHALSEATRAVRRTRAAYAEANTTLNGRVRHHAEALDREIANLRRKHAEPLAWTVSRSVSGGRRYDLGAYPVVVTEGAAGYHLHRPVVCPMHIADVDTLGDAQRIVEALALADGYTLVRNVVTTTTPGATK